MNLHRTVTRLLNKSLSLPEEAQCDICGYFAINHPEVRKALAASGWSFDDAFAYIHCKCGDEEREKKEREQEVRKYYTRTMTRRSTFHKEYAKGFEPPPEATRKPYRDD